MLQILLKKTECTPLKSDAANETICNYYINADFHDNETLNLEFKLTSILYKEKKGLSRLFDYITGKEKKYTAAFFEEETKNVVYHPCSFQKKKESNQEF